MAKAERTISIGRHFLSAPTLLSFAFAFALVAVLTFTFDLDWQATWRSIQGMNLWLYALAALMHMAPLAPRGIRWRMLAENAQGAQSDIRLPSWAWMGGLIAISGFVNSVTWLRLGDPYRAHALSQDSGATFSWSLGSVFSERMLDMITVAALVVASVALLGATGDLPAIWRWYIIGAATAMALGICLCAVAMKRWGAGLARILPAGLAGAYRAFESGALRSLDRLPAILSLGLVGWAMEIARIYLVFATLDVDASFAFAPVVALGNAMLSIAPMPGGLGVVEPGTTGLLLLELSATDAAAVVIIDRSITYLVVVAVGGALFAGRYMVRAWKR